MTRNDQEKAMPTMTASLNLPREVSRDTGRTGLGSPVGASATGNRLLASLPESDLRHLAALSHSVTAEVGEVLYDPGQPIAHIYFPDDCLISLLAVAEGRMTLEVGSVGREGVGGASAALGHDLAPGRAVG